MIWILLGIYFVLEGVFALVPVNIPHWPMAVFAIVIGLICLWTGFGKAKPPSA